jgi:hydrogenase maturation protease
MIPPILLVGIGNEFRGDDGAGLYIVRQLKTFDWPGVSSKEESGEGFRLMEVWREFNTVFIFDAVSSGAKPGTIFRFDARQNPLPKDFFCYSTHAFGVAEAVEMARALYQLPPDIFIYGIEGKNFESGGALSPEVTEAAQEVLERVRHDIEATLQAHAHKRSL